MSESEVNIFNWIVQPMLVAFYLVVFATIAVWIETSASQRNRDTTIPAPARGTDWLHVGTYLVGLLAIAWLLLKYGLAFLLWMSRWD